MKRLLATLAAALLFALIPVTAEAKYVYTNGAGLIEGWYYPSPDRDYIGSKQPSGNFCVDVQRKNSDGVWTSNGVANPTNCNPSVQELWEINTDSSVSNTYGIRIRNQLTGATATLCTTKSMCLAM